MPLARTGFRQIADVVGFAPDIYTTAGVYDITAFGGSGGANAASRGGDGAEIGGEIALTKGEILTVLVGQQGHSGIGGGGATYVVLSPGTTLTDLLVVAGGGGGGAGGNGSGGLALASGSGAGGGYLHGGYYLPLPFTGHGGGGYNGGIASGGASNTTHAPGGAGYTGGAGNTTFGLGGSSYLGASLTELVSVAGENAGNGYVSITQISTSVPEPSTWAMLMLGFAGLGFAGYRRRVAA